MDDRQRVDVALVQRGLARSRGQARDLIRSGEVLVNGRAVLRPSTPVGPDDELGAPTDRYVSRAAHKLLGALDEAGLAVSGRALDAGASTGGFTQVLLERGCDHVYAVDVGTGQLVDELRRDPRVTAREHLNLRDLTLADVDGEPVDVLVADVSFISLRLLVEPMLAVLRPDGVALLMVKPQFEVGRAGLDSRGVVVNDAAREDAVDLVVADAERLGWACVWRGRSPLPGGEGNVEFFVELRHGSARSADLS
ncbi:TlyA family RNA methyltransferase [Nigerium massiliense]|uniref:TlyA family RNA methyltransferase n=1 Tax=Nigerium massiliense TaxID=1522317 RepID=UPI00058C95CD|nr:TlyA family RNA methyltransferase [Nigerium massiliense]